MIFEFLKYCLGNEVDMSGVVAKMDWRQLYAFSAKQALLGFCFDGIERLGREYPDELKANPIGQDLLMAWMGKAQQIRRQNMKVNVVAGKLYRQLRGDGLKCCILKGQGNALMYPNPYCRTSGDIDMWVNAGRGRITEYAKGHFAIGDDIRYHHIETTVDGVPVELHFVPCIMNNPVYNGRLQRWFGRNGDAQCDHLVCLPDGAGEVAVPTAEYNVIYQLCHLYHHFFDEGIGLRQIIDYYFVLTNTEITNFACSAVQSAELKRNLNGTSASDSSFLNTNNTNNTNYASSAIQSAELKRNLNGNITSGSSFLNTNNTNCTNNACSAIQSAELKRNLNGNITSGSSFLNTNNANCTNNACSAVQSAELKRKQRSTTEGKVNLNGTSASDSSFSNTNNTNEGESQSVNFFSNTENTEHTDMGDGQSVKSVRSVGEKKNYQSVGENNPSAGDRDYPLRHELKYLGLWKFAGAVMWVLHETLGLEESLMIAPMDEKRGRLLLAEILDGGNFGKHAAKYGHFTRQGMAKKYFLKIWRNMHFVRCYPAEALSEPVFRTWHFFWRIFHR